MAKSLDDEMAAIEAEERKLAERRKAHQRKLRETAIGMVEKAGLLRLPLDRLERLMEVVKTLGMEVVEQRLMAADPAAGSSGTTAQGGEDAGLDEVEDRLMAKA